MKYKFNVGEKVFVKYYNVAKFIKCSAKIGRVESICVNKNNMVVYSVSIKGNKNHKKCFEKDLLSMDKKYIKVSYEAIVHEDSYYEGEGKFVNSWTNREAQLTSLPYTIEEALKAICDANNFKFDKNNWYLDPCDEHDLSRFDTDLMVDVDNNEVTEEDNPELYKKWKKGEVKLYNCHIIANLVVCEERNLSLKEIAEFNM